MLHTGKDSPLRGVVPRRQEVAAAPAAAMQDYERIGAGSAAGTRTGSESRAKRRWTVARAVGSKVLHLFFFTLGAESLSAISVQLISEGYCHGRIDEGLTIFTLILSLLTSGLAYILPRIRGGLTDYLNGLCAALCILLGALVHAVRESCSRYVAPLAYVTSGICALVILLDMLQVAERERRRPTVTQFRSNGQSNAARGGVRG